MPRKAIFHHIQKTAGTSVVTMAKEIYGSHNITSHADFTTLKPEDRHKVPFLSGHFGYAYFADLLPERYSFVFLRDPIDRVISFYNFCRSQPEDIYPIYSFAKSVNIMDFVLDSYTQDKTDRDRAARYERVWNNQTWQIAHGWVPVSLRPERKTVLDFSPDTLLDMAKEHLMHYNHVGLMETFEDDMKLIISELAPWKNVSMEKKNVSKKTLRRSELTEEEINVISDATRLDCALYDYALTMNRRKHVPSYFRQPMAMLKRLPHPFRKTG